MTIGSIHATESQMMQGVIGFEKLITYAIMIPHSKIVWIEQSAKHEDVWPIIMRSAQDVFPVYQGRRENLVGAVSIKDIDGQLSAGTPVSFPAIMHPHCWFRKPKKRAYC